MQSPVLRTPSAPERSTTSPIPSGETGRGLPSHVFLTAAATGAQNERRCRIVRINSTGTLREYAQQWDDLWSRSDVIPSTARAHPVANWVEHFAPHATLCALAVEQDGRLVAALPLYRETVGKFLRVVRLPRNGWASAGDLLIDSVDPEPALDCLAQALTALSSSLLWLPLVPFQEPTWLALQAAMTRAGMPFTLEEQYQIPQVEITSDWDTYDRTRDGDARRSRRRYAKMLERDGGAELRVHTRFAPGELERLLRLGFEVEDRSWKGEAGSSVLKRPGLFEFTLRQAHLLAERGELQLVFLHLAGQPIAFSYRSRSRGCQFCEKLGYDQEFRRYGPGQQMMMRLLQRLHEDPECHLLDFAGRLVDWNAAWATRTYPVGRLVAAPSGVVSRTLLELYRRGRPYLEKLRTPRGKP